MRNAVREPEVGSIGILYAALAIRHRKPAVTLAGETELAHRPSRQPAR